VTLPFRDPENTGSDLGYSRSIALGIKGVLNPLHLAAKLLLSIVAFTLMAAR